VTINFGDQQQEFETLLTDSGVLNGASYKVSFVEFGSGPLVDAGFAAHRIDVGEMGDLPASLAVKSGLPVTAIASGTGPAAPRGGLPGAPAPAVATRAAERRARSHTR
jgi:sulfonate transport system substrate-binding protein